MLTFFHFKNIFYYSMVNQSFLIAWESARFTKPEKQLTAYETWQKLYPDIDMAETLKKLGFWENEKNSSNL